MKIFANVCNKKEECDDCPINEYCCSDLKYWEYAEDNMEKNEEQKNKENKEIKMEEKKGIL